MNIKNDEIVNQAPTKPSQSLNGLLIILLCIAVFCLGISFVTFGQAFLDHGNSLNPPEYNELKVISGKLNTVNLRRKRGLVVTDDRTSINYFCSYGQCGYKDSSKDIGKQVRLLVYGRAIYQIEVDNIIRFSYADKISNTSRDLWVGGAALLVFFLTIVAMLVLKILAWRFK